MKRFSVALASASAAAFLLLPAIPAQAHGIAAAGFLGGLAHPFMGFDHLLMLVGVGLAASFISSTLLTWALGGALVGAVLESLGVSLPAGELWAALAISAVGLMTLLSARYPLAPIASGVVGLGVSAHSLLHGLEAPHDGSTALWWLGALSASGLIAGATYLVFQFLARRGVGRAVMPAAALLTLSGGVLVLSSL